MIWYLTSITRDNLVDPKSNNPKKTFNFYINLFKGKIVMLYLLLIKFKY